MGKGDRALRYAERQRAEAFQRKREKQMSIKESIGEIFTGTTGGGGVFTGGGGQFFSPPRPATKEEMLASELDMTRRERDEMARAIERLNRGSFNVARIAAIYDNRVLIRNGGSYIEVEKPEFPVVTGDAVRIASQTSQLVGVVEREPGIGMVAKVASVSALGCEVDVGPMHRSVVVAASVGELKAGDAVVVDDSMSFVIRRAVGITEELHLDDATGISWDDIGGHEEAKEAIREAIEYPIRHAELYRGYAKAPAKGVLLYGPPGCGKTLLARAAATALRDAHGGSAPGGFISVKGPEILDKFVGSSEAAIRGLFESARRYKQKTGHPAVVFIDEADALLGKRSGMGRTLVGMEQTIVPAFLAEMDGVEDSGAFVMLSTNRPDVLDSAVIRDGRIDRKIYIGRPTPTTALAILKLAMRGRPVAQGQTVDRVCELAIEHAFGDEPVVQEVGLLAGTPVRLRLRDVISGAILAGIANRATDRAIRRDRAARAAGPSGISTEDLAVAVRESARELAGTDLQHEIVALVQSLEPRASASAEAN